MRNISIKLFRIRTSGPRGNVVLKRFLIKSSGSSFFGVVKPLCNFCRGYHEEHLCDIILNLDQWFRRRCCIKDISHLELYGHPFVGRSGTICAI